MRAVVLLLPALALSQKLTFHYDTCEDYCLQLNPYSFTYTKQACPVGGQPVEKGGFKADECDQDDLTISYVKIKDDQLKFIQRQTSVEEAMRVCGDETTATLEDGTVWKSPELKFREAVNSCRNNHGDGTGWAGAGFDPRTGTKTNDVDYRQCLQTAYDDCQENEPWPENCKDLLDVDVMDMSPSQIRTWYTFCWDEQDDMQKRTCNKYKNIYDAAEESCFEDDKYKGYQACITHAQSVYQYEVYERQAICDKTFIIARNNISCEGSFGYVLCCCQLIGTMITHPPEQTCEDNFSYTQCKKWRDQGRCDPNDGDYVWMSENCEFTCGICADVPPANPSSCPSVNTGSAKPANPENGCMCMDEYAAEMDFMEDGFFAYIQAAEAAGENLCLQLSGTWNGSACEAAKTVAKVKCSNVESAPVCRALGCQLGQTMSFGDKYEFVCGGKPTAIM